MYIQHIHIPLTKCTHQSNQDENKMKIKIQFFSSLMQTNFSTYQQEYQKLKISNV